MYPVNLGRRKLSLDRNSNINSVGIALNPNPWDFPGKPSDHIYKSPYKIKIIEDQVNNRAIYGYERRKTRNLASDSN